MPRFKLRILLIVLAIGPPVLAQDAAKSKQHYRDNPSPANWKVSELNDAMPLRWIPGELNVLVWEVTENDKEINERCLVLKRYERPSDDGKSYALSYLRRFPNDAKPQWRAVQLVGRLDRNSFQLSPLFGYELYRTAPSDSDIESFLDDYSWKGEFAEHFAIVTDPETRTLKSRSFTPTLKEGGVCNAAWLAFFGRSPPDALFPELIAK